MFGTNNTAPILLSSTDAAPGVIGWTLLFELDTLGTCPQQSGLTNGNFGGIMNSIFGHSEDKD